MKTIYWRVVAMFVLGVTWQACTGCAVVGAVAAKTVGDVPDPAAYTLPKEPTLVVVENFNHPADHQGPADQLAELITRHLNELKIVPAIEQSKLAALRTSRPKEFDRMKITDLGKELGAKQVVYVDLKECDVYRTVGADALQARVEAYAKVVDVATGQTKFPVAGDGQPFKTASDFTPQDQSDTPLAMRNQLIEQLSASITQLFYQKKAY